MYTKKHRLFSHIFKLNQERQNNNTFESLSQQFNTLIHMITHFECLTLHAHLFHDTHLSI